MIKQGPRPKNKKVAQKSGTDPFLVGIVVVTGLILAGVIYLGSKIGAAPQVKADPQVELAVSSTQYDWGTIDINGGVVSQSFSIQNKGSAPLKLYNVATSCMCTTAQLKSADQVSKKFGMHEKTGSVFTVGPGSRVELIVEFDPAFHGPSGLGPISRTVTVYTNDMQNPKLVFNLTARVIKD